MKEFEKSAEEISREFLTRGGQAVFGELSDITALSAPEIHALPDLPYSDETFSRRLLREQLNPDTTDSSRPLTVVGRQLAWLRTYLTDWRPGDVLHPLCGPGVWAEALQDYGVASYLGIDVGPAVVEYARERLSEVPSCTFVSGDATDLSVLPSGESYDTVMFTYDSFNFFTLLRIWPLLEALVQRLRSGGTVVLDLRLTEDGRVGFDEGRQVQRRPNGSVFRDGPHLLLSEAFVADAGGLIGHRIIALGTECGSAPPSVFHSVLNVPSLDTLTAQLNSVGLRVLVAGEPFPDSNDPNLRRHLVAARKK